jgi:hypothetical protein
MKIISVLSLLLTFNLLNLSLAHSFSGWDVSNDPENMRWFTRKNFRALPLEGSLKKRPWSGDYWPTYKGGITYRWASETVLDSQRWSYSTPGAGVTINELSPIEKYDLYLGNTNFELTRMERKRTGIISRKKIPEWEGLCHAWAPATYLYENPHPVTVKDPRGNDITFYSSDIKALLTYHLHYSRAPKTNFLGSRCNLDFSDLKKKYDKGLITKRELIFAMNSPECKDTNPGAFHVILTNFIGRLNRSFIIDITRDLEVWNQPVYAYKSVILDRRKSVSPHAHPNTKEEVTIQTIVYYIEEVPQTYKRYLNPEALTAATYVYNLELDKRGRIIGGSWISDERPDFIWTQNKPKFKGAFKKLKKLYKRAK